MPVGHLFVLLLPIYLSFIFTYGALDRIANVLEVKSNENLLTKQQRQLLCEALKDSAGMRADRAHYNACMELRNQLAKGIEVAV